MLLQVHDELLLETPEEEVDEVRSIVVDVMCHAVQLDAPLKVDVSTGQNWLELKA
jgi:DNA polymerase-1